MSDLFSANPYQVLGVPKTAEVADIKKAYRKLVLTCHPDKTGSLPEALKKEKDEQFHKVQQAHDLLTNEAERQRYDDRQHLEELHSELRSDLRRSTRRDVPVPSPTYRTTTFSSRMPPRPSPAKTATSPIFDTRGPPIYETRAPKGSYDDEYQPSGHYETYRQTPSKKHDDRFYEPATSRRSAGRPSDDRRSERREPEDDYFSNKTRQKEAKKEHHTVLNDRKKNRDKTRRSDAEAKRYARHDSESDSDSEIDAFMNSGRPSDSRRRVDESARKPRFEERPRPAPSTPSSDDEEDPRLRDATAHMAASGTRVSERDSRHEKRNSTKTRSTRTPPPPPPPPPPPMVPKVETAKRSSARRTTSSKSAKKLDIVDPPLRGDYDDYYEPTPRKPKAEPVSSSRSSPKASSLKNMLRAATFGDNPSSEKPPPVRRASTTPHNMSMGNPPTRSSKLKHSHTTVQEEDSSSGTGGSAPEATPQRYTTTSYKYRVKPESDSEGGPDVRKPRIVPIEPHDHAPSGGTPSSRRDREKDHGPAPQAKERGSSRRDDLPPRSPAGAEARDPHRSSHRSELRSPPARSNTFDNSGLGTRERSRHKHSSSAEGGGNASGGSGLLFGELPPSDVKYSKNIDKADILYSPTGGNVARRGSADSPSAAAAAAAGLASPSSGAARERGADRHSRDSRDGHRARERGKDDYPYERAKDGRAGSRNPGMAGRSSSYAPNISV